MRIFLDCSQTIRESMNTGIQRVVRNLVRFARTTATPLSVQSVFGARNRLWTICEPIESPAVDQLSDPHTLPRSIYTEFKKIIARAFPFESVDNFLYAPRWEFGLNSIIVGVMKKFGVPLRWQGAQFPQGSIEINPQYGDVIVALDIFFSERHWHRLRRAKEGGAIFIPLFYDIIPVTHPRFFESKFCARFERWLQEAIWQADAFIAISDATRIAVLDYIAHNPKLRNRINLPSDSFQLGFDLDGAQAGTECGLEIQKLFATLHHAPIYLSVNTVEPRKNIPFIIDAFELLWARGLEVQLCLFGNVGWLAQNLLARIESHPQLRRRLHYLGAVSDSDLDYAYRKARGLVVASVVEGFGLPLVEALSYGLPVFASDIPVFHEIGRHAPEARIRFFDLADPHNLASAIEEHESAPQSTSPVPFSWLNWKQSTQIFLDKVQKLAQRRGRAT